MRLIGLPPPTTWRATLALSPARWAAAACPGTSQADRHHWGYWNGGWLGVIALVFVVVSAQLGEIMALFQA